jgi:hypothetical protein
MALNAGNLEMTPVLCSTGQKADQTICELLFFAEHRGHRHSHDGLDPTDSKVALLRSHDKIGFVSRKSGRSLPLLLWRLPKSNAASATVLVDELGVDSLGHAADGLRRLLCPPPAGPRFSGR